MKKTLYTTTALAAAGLISLASSDAYAQAAATAPAQKFTIGLGGFMIQTFGYATNDRHYVGGSALKKVDQKSDSEVYFTGSMNLDNGLTVYMQVQLEADAGNGGQGAGTAQVDESWLTIGSAEVGTLLLGSTNSANFTLAVGAPFSGLNFNDGTLNNWVVSPNVLTGATVTNAAFATSGDGPGDANRVTYTTPSFAGLRLAAGFAPDTVATNTTTQPAATTQDEMELAAQYTTQLGDFTPRLYGGYWQYNGITATSTNNWSTGADVTYGDWTLGGGFTHTQSRYDDGLNAAATLSPNVHSWNAGLKYNPGPYNVALTYGHGWARDTFGDPDSSTENRVQLGGEYILAAGVKVLGSLFYQNFNAETSNNAAGNTNENAGWAAVTGIRLDF